MFWYVLRIFSLAIPFSHEDACAVSNEGCTLGGVEDCDGDLTCSNAAAWRMQYCRMLADENMPESPSHSQWLTMMDPARLCCKYRGITALILFPDFKGVTYSGDPNVVSLDEPLWQTHAARWDNCTGSKFLLSYKGQQETMLELVRDVGTNDGTIAGANILDAYMTKGATVGSVWERLEDLTPRIANTPGIDWLDVARGLRSSSSYNGTVRMIPTDGDTEHIVFRSDLLRDHNKNPPKTLEEWVELVEYFNGKDLNNDGTPDFGHCISMKERFKHYRSLLVAMLAQFWQTTPDRGLFWDLKTFVPAWNTSAFKEVVKLFTRIMAVRGDDDGENHVFNSGRCFSLSHYTGGLKLSLKKTFTSLSVRRFDADRNLIWTPKQADGQTYAPPSRALLPGSRRVMDWASIEAGQSITTAALIYCTLETCPHALGVEVDEGVPANASLPDTYQTFGPYTGINRAPFWPEGGWVMSIRSKSCPLKKQLVWDLLSYHYSPEISRKWATGRKHMDQHRGSQVCMGRDPTTATTCPNRAYFESVNFASEAIDGLFWRGQQTLTHPNPAIDIRNPGQTDGEDGSEGYFTSLNKAVEHTFKQPVCKEFTLILAATGCYKDMDLSEAEQSIINCHLPNDGKQVRCDVPYTQDELAELAESKFQAFITELLPKWKAITDSYGGTFKQLTAYRASLNLPPYYLSCEGGYTFDESFGKCVVCPAGKYSRATAGGTINGCEPCEAGYACPEGTASPLGAVQACKSGNFSGPGASQCSMCSVGTFASSFAHSACADCTPGRYTDMVGSSECMDCAVGMYQGKQGRTNCISCSARQSHNYTKAIGGWDCSPCAMQEIDGVTECCDETSRRLTTMFRGATSREHCGCLAGLIEISGLASGSDTQINSHEETERASQRMTRFCQDCFDGLTCPIFSSTDRLVTGQHYEGMVASVDAGFMSDPSDPLLIYECRPSKNCQGGVPGSCRGGLQGIPCSTCPLGETWTGDVCDKCYAFVEVAWRLAIPLLLGMSVIGYYIMSTPITAKGTNLLPVTCSFAIMVTGIQKLGIIGSIKVPDMPSASDSFFSFITIFSADLGSLGFNCAFGDAASSRYFTKVLAFPVGILWLGIAAILSQAGPVNLRFKFYPLASTVGASVQLMFTTLCVVALQPFMCYSHPFPNDKSSLSNYPQIMCGTSEHVELQIGGIFLLSLGVAFSTLTSISAFCAPKWSVDAPHRINALKFLLFKYRMDRWAYGSILIFRGPLLTLPLALATDYPHVQALLAVVVLLAFLVLQLVFWPWKVPLINALDAWVSATMLVLVVVTTSFLPTVDAVKSGFEVVWYLIHLSVFTIAFLIMIVALVFYLNRMLNGSGGTEENIIMHFGRVPDCNVLGKQLRDVGRALGDRELEDIVGCLETLHVSDLRAFIHCISVLVFDMNIPVDNAREFTCIKHVSTKSRTVSSLDHKTSKEQRKYTRNSSESDASAGYARSESVTKLQQISGLASSSLASRQISGQAPSVFPSENFQESFEQILRNVCYHATGKSERFALSQEMRMIMKEWSTDGVEQNLRNLLDLATDESERHALSQEMLVIMKEWNMDVSFLPESTRLVDLGECRLVDL